MKKQVRIESTQKTYRDATVNFPFFYQDNYMDDIYFSCSDSKILIGVYGENNRFQYRLKMCNGEIHSLKVDLWEYEDGIPRPEDCIYLSDRYASSKKEFLKYYDKIKKFLNLAALGAEK